MRHPGEAESMGLPSPEGAPATEGTVPCPTCGYANQVEDAICFVCGRSTRVQQPAPPSPGPALPSVPYLRGPDEDARRAYRTALRNEEGVVGLLRFVYTLYAVGYLTLTVLLLVAGLVKELDGPTQLLLLLFPLSSLAVVLLAIRRLEEEPFAWALVMAGMETLAFVHALETQTHRALHALAAILLWSGVFMCARAFSVRRLWAEGVTTGRGDRSDIRIPVALLMLYGGVFLLLKFAFDWGGYEIHIAQYVFWGGIVALGVVSALVAGSGVLADSLRFGVRLGDVRPTVVVLLGLVLADTLLLTWLGGAWIPDLPRLAWPGQVFFLAVVIAPGVFEEWLCRGVMWSCIRERVHTGPTILATATLFALMHGLDQGGLVTVVPQLIAGVLLGILRARTGSLVPCMVAHGLGNLYVGAWEMGALDAFVP